MLNTTHQSLDIWKAHCQIFTSPPLYKMSTFPTMSCNLITHKVPANNQWSSSFHHIWSLEVLSQGMQMGPSPGFSSLSWGKEQCEPLVGAKSRLLLKGPFSCSLQAGSWIQRCSGLFQLFQEDRDHLQSNLYIQGYFNLNPDGIFPTKWNVSSHKNSGLETVWRFENISVIN